MTMSRELVAVHRDGAAQRAYDRAGVEIAYPSNTPEPVALANCPAPPVTT